ncbi:LOB domain-containing protein 7-like [Prosopis cineraria]|uniref:LOB domain-containing protein 7-like n=1 Tax=Prosopis cineraria TaxID=364024 RepID=UPI00240ED01B|nr:LOB domain-containing protein 7-like [Prosopis cineraria]
MERRVTARHKGSICHENCEYRQIFPGNRYSEFENAERLFGVSNMLTIIQSVEAHQRQVAADSMFVEANAWRNHPVRGVLGFASDLISQIHSHSNQLQVARKQLQIFNHHHHHQDDDDDRLQSQNMMMQIQMPTSSSSPEIPPPSGLQLHDSTDEILSVMSEIISFEEVKPLEVQEIMRLLEYYRRRRVQQTRSEIKVKGEDQSNVGKDEKRIAIAEVSEDENLDIIWCHF